MSDDGKLGVAPCGHVGVHVISQYVMCPSCDRTAVPEHIVDEETKQFCRECGSDDVEQYPGFTVFGRELWRCHNCNEDFKV